MTGPAAVAIRLDRFVVRSQYPCTSGTDGVNVDDQGSIT